MSGVTLAGDVDFSVVVSRKPVQPLNKKLKWIFGCKTEKQSLNNRKPVKQNRRGSWFGLITGTAITGVE